MEYLLCVYILTLTVTYNACSSREGSPNSDSLPEQVKKMLRVWVFVDVFHVIHDIEEVLKACVEALFYFYCY